MSPSKLLLPKKRTVEKSANSDQPADHVNGSLLGVGEGRRAHAADPPEKRSDEANGSPKRESTSEITENYIVGEERKRRQETSD